MLKILSILFLFSSFVFAGPREEAQAYLESLSHESSASVKLEAYSRMFVGLPYGKNGPLGEGPLGKYDQDPLYRFDTFDCTTYVETIMALTQAKDVDEFEDILNNIRYEDGIIDYLKRNHFTDLQWIPNNIHTGQLTEITAETFGEANIKIAEADINFPGWLKSHKVEQIVLLDSTLSERKMRLSELHAEAVNYVVQKATVPYVSIKTLIARPALLNKVPQGSLVNFVRPNWDLTEAAGTHQNISHQGFLFWKKAKLYLRHASTTGKVEDVLFLDYLKKFENHTTLKGIHLMGMGFIR